MRYEKEKQSKIDIVAAGFKRKNDEQIAAMSARVKGLNDEPKHLLELADRKALECEKKASLKITAESNVFGAAAKLKQKEADHIFKRLQEAKHIL